MDLDLGIGSKYQRHGSERVIEAEALDYEEAAVQPEKDNQSSKDGSEDDAD